jgi:ParB-like chromosome segregation protein Spo0J
MNDLLGPEETPVRVTLSGDVMEVPLARMRPTPDAENPNKMSPEAYLMLEEAVRVDAEKGSPFKQPLLLAPVEPPDAGGFAFVVVDGEHRRRAALAAGLTSVPAVVVEMTDEEIKAWRLGMNRNRGEIDLAVAREIVLDLTSEGWSVQNLVVTGFSADEISDLTKSAASTVSDLIEDAGTAEVEDAPAVAAKPFVLEIPFVDKKQYELAKRKLRKAAGKTKDLARGLLNVLGEETE